MKSIPVSLSSSSSLSSWKQPADHRERHRTSTASVRCDFIMNLDPLMRREGGSAATTDEEPCDATAEGPSSVLPRPSSTTSTTTSTQSRHRRQLKTHNDNQSSGSTATNDARAKANRGGRKGGRAVEHEGIGAAGQGGECDSSRDFHVRTIMALTFYFFLADAGAASLNPNSRVMWLD